MSAERIAALRAEARTARQAGDSGRAAALEREAADACAAAGLAEGRAHALRHAADILSESGDPAAAAPLYAEALAYYGEAATLDAANALRGAALNAERLGDPGEARRLWSRARAVYAGLDAWFAVRLGHNPGVAEADRRLARLSR